MFKLTRHVTAHFRNRLVMRNNAKKQRVRQTNKTYCFTLSAIRMLNIKCLIV